MEKKGNRNTPNSSRGSSGTDLKKSQDVTSKQWPRGVSRRREPPSGFSKSTEPSRKPQPQRNTKASDKRPKPRGFYYTGAISRNEETCLEEFEEPELGSVFSPGSKKQSLNHLLNFSFAPRENHQGSYQPGRNGTNQQGAKWLVTKKHKYNKEHFLQANCQFIVNQKGDYKQYMSNPDALVDWDLIEQVNVQVNEQPSCPICLYPPVAAKMTKCGHVYCWSCILHYLALSDKQWRKCPICFDSIKKEDLKSVIAIPHKTFTINDSITFKLMKRERGSLTAYPADAIIPSDGAVFSMFDKNKENCYSKLLLADKESILQILDRENTELEVQMSEDGNCPEICFMEEAVRYLIERRDKVLTNGSNNKVFNKNLIDSLSNANTIQDIAVNNTKDSSSAADKTDNTSSSGSTNDDLKNSNSVEEFSLADAECGPQVPKFHYFYQAADGQQIYLHAINAKMLEHTYGSLEFGPKTLTGKILEKEGGSMTEELRKKLRYLQHMPVTCQFEVAEIRLHEPIVKKETLDRFKEQIEIRKKRRQRRAKEEKKREKRIEVEENRKIGKYVTPDLHLESRDQFPDVKEAHDMFPEFLDHRNRSESESTFRTERSSSPDLSSSVSSMSLDSGYTGPSFATMLATEKKPSWPSLQPSQSTKKPSSTPGTLINTPVKLINVTGSKLTNSVFKITQRRHEESDPEALDYEPVPDFNRSFGDALAQALAKSVEDNGDQEASESGVSGKKKKKKNKQKLLFSTHMALSGN